jgi:hypothetical protein
MAARRAEPEATTHNYYKLDCPDRSKRETKRSKRNGPWHTHAKTDTHDGKTNKKGCPSLASARPHKQGPAMPDRLEVSPPLSARVIA